MRREHVTQREWLTMRTLSRWLVCFVSWYWVSSAGVRAALGWLTIRTSSVRLVFLNIVVLDQIVGDTWHKDWLI